MIDKWYTKYPFWGVVNSDPKNPESRLSPLTNLTLNMLASATPKDNFIICIPSITLRPIPLVCYILADQTQKSVLVFSRNVNHYNNYYLLKVRYPRNFAYIKYPAAKIERGTINIDLYAPNARRSYKNRFKALIPQFKNKFFNQDYPKILFNLKRNIKFSNSITNLSLEDKNIESSTSEKKLGIGNIIFENLDHYIYNTFKFEIFEKWIENFRDFNHRFIFHISNPNFRLLDDFKNRFNAHVLYFPFSFLRANEDLIKMNKKYFNKYYSNEYNLDSYDIYTLTTQDNITIEKPLRRGNIDRYFVRGIKLFEKINWNNVQKDLAPIIYQLRQLFFSIYKMFCIPNEFNVKHFDDEIGWKSYHLDFYLRITLRFIRKYSTPPTSEILKSILIFLSKMVSELSECKRYQEVKSYSRKGKNFALCEYLENNLEKKIIIGVQRGEKKLIADKLEDFVENGDIRVATLRQLARSIKDFSNYTLLLAGHLLPSHFQILFKNWKEIRFFVYKGKNFYWIKNQIKLIDQIDLSKEELSLKYLAEVYRSVIGESNYSIEKDPLFRHFLEKKKRLLALSDAEDYGDDDHKHKIEDLGKDVVITSSSITDICRQIMKSSPKYRDMIREEKVKLVVKRYRKKSNQKYLENIEHFDCIVALENEISGDKQTINLDVKKKYLYFKNKEDIRIESCFPHSLKKGYYIILFGERQKLSISDFMKHAFELDEDIDYKLIEEWQGRLASYFLSTYPKRVYADFHREFIKSTSSTISSQQFNNWVKGNTNYTQDPLNLYYLGELMEDDFFKDQFKLIHEEGRKIQRFNQKLSRRIKKLVVQVIDGNISRADCSPDELLLLENIENCIFKINDIQIKK